MLGFSQMQKQRNVESRIATILIATFLILADVIIFWIDESQRCCGGKVKEADGINNDDPKCHRNIALSLLLYL